MRQVENVNALVLRKTSYGESDLIISFFCRSLGKVDAMARSARQSRKRFGAGLELFTLSEITMTQKPRASMWNLVSAQPQVSFHSLGQNIGSMAHASYGTELVRELSANEQADPQLFDLLLNLYQSLEGDGPKAGRLRVFEMKLLDAMGLTPMVRHCTLCHLASAGMSGNYWDPDQGGVLCSSCFSQQLGSKAKPISDEAISLLARAQGLSRIEEGDDLDRMADCVAARTAMLSLLYWHVGKPLKSVEFIAKLSKAR